MAHGGLAKNVCMPASTSSPMKGNHRSSESTFQFDLRAVIAGVVMADVLLGILVWCTQNTIWGFVSVTAIFVYVMAQFLALALALGFYEWKHERNKWRLVWHFAAGPAAVLGTVLLTGIDLHIKPKWANTPWLELFLSLGPLFSVFVAPIPYAWLRRALAERALLRNLSLVLFVLSCASYVLLPLWMAYGPEKAAVDPRIAALSTRTLIEHVIAPKPSRGSRNWLKRRAEEKQFKQEAYVLFSRNGKAIPDIVGALRQISPESVAAGQYDVEGILDLLSLLEKFGGTEIIPELRRWNCPEGHPDVQRFANHVLTINGWDEKPVGPSITIEGIDAISEQQEPQTSSTAESEHKAGDTATFAGIEFIWCPPGEFAMGRATREQQMTPHEGPAHLVKLSRGFWLAKYECTQSQWEREMEGHLPERFRGSSYGDTASRPVEQVSWDDVQGYIAILNLRNPGMNFRLPTEAEWEYAYRSGTETRFYWGDDPRETQAGEYVWCAENSGRQPHDVGGKKANAWGFCDMGGNVSEWVQDLFAEYRPLPVLDPKGPSTGSKRVCRGGAWDRDADQCHAAFRQTTELSVRSDSIGFRLARQDS